MMQQMMRPGSECPACSGRGQFMYGSTSTYMGGIGGAAMTNDVCDQCWGSGDATNPFADLKKLRDEYNRLRKAEWRRDNPWLVTMGVRELEELIARNEYRRGDWAVVSIGARDERIPDAVAKFDDSLRVEFDDNVDARSGGKGGLKPRDAANILKFVKRHKEKVWVMSKSQTTERVVIHCTMGVSRSVSVAQAVGLVLGLDLKPRPIFNYGAYRAILEAAKRDASFPDE